jgi:hypothetical protein
MVEAAAVAFSGRKIDSMDSDWKIFDTKGIRRLSNCLTRNRRRNGMLLQIIARAWVCRS